MCVCACVRVCVCACAEEEGHTVVATWVWGVASQLYGSPDVCTSATGDSRM